MRYLYFRVVLWVLFCAAVPAQAQIRVDIGFPGINIGINLSSYPRLVRIPGYPVYYDPRANSNYFFYDGLYWVYQADNWYASSWYNGPWQLIEPYDVPLYLLRVPVRYYRHPPTYFRGWRADAAPRWGEHWGGEWEKRRAGWDQWDRRSAPPAAPLPSYQQQYSGNRYPRAPEQQGAILAKNYRYQPREAVTQQHFQQVAPQQAQQQAAPRDSRSEPHSQAPVPQQVPQHRQATPQRQQPQSMQPRSEQPVQQAQPRQPAQPTQSRQPVQQEQRGQRVQQQPSQPVQAQPRQPPAQAQRAQTPQGKGQENRAAPQGKGQENRAAPQGKGQENKPASQGKGQENKKEERDTGRQ